MRTNGLEYLDAEIEDNGVIPLSKLGIGNWKESPYAGINIERQFRNQVANIGDRVGIYDDTQGISDIGNLTNEQLQDALYNTQTGMEMVGNALKGMAAIAGTTYVSNTLGLANILLEGTWDNTVNNYMAELENTARDKWQIYRPSDYEEKSFMEKLGNSVFWADLVQNMGFTLGAGAAAATFAAIPGMNVLGKAPAIIQKVIPSLFGAIGEASIEAVHHKNTETEGKQRKAIQQYDKMMASAKTPYAQALIQDSYEQALLDIEEDERKAGNFVFGANIALLTLSNTIEFGDIFARGFGTGRRIANSARKAAQETVEDVAFSPLKKFSKAGAIAKGAAIGLGKQSTEAAEEVSQGIITKAASANEDYNSFNNSKFNPEKREVVSGMVQSLVQGYSEVMHDPNTAIEAAMGFFTGALGMPRLRKSVVPVALEGGILGSIRDEVKEVNDLNRTIDNINNRLQNNKELTSYYDGLVRHLVYQDAEDAALENDDHKAFADANSAKFISDIVMFDRVGRLDLLNQIIQNSTNLTYEEIESLIQETSKDGDGPFMTNGNKMTPEEVRKKLKEKADVLTSKVESYVKTKEKLLEKYPTLSEDSVDEALYYRLQSEDIIRRNKSIRDNIFGVLSNIVNLERTMAADQKAGIAAAMTDVTRDNVAIKLSEKNSPLLKALNDAINSGNYHIPTYDVQTVQEGINDYAKNIESLEKYTESFNSLVADPKKANKKNERVRREAANRQETESRVRNSRDIATQVINSSVGEVALSIREGAVNIDDISIPDLGDLEEGFTSQVKEANKLNNAISAVEEEVASIENTPDNAKKDAVSLFVYAANHSPDVVTALDSQTIESLTEEQLSEAFGRDLSEHDNLEEVIEELENRRQQALEILSDILPNAEAQLAESDKMSAQVEGVDISIPQKGNDPITPVSSVSNEGAVPQPRTTPSRKNTESVSRSSNSNEWSSGYSYMYTGKEEKHKGKTYYQFVRDEINELVAKETLTAEESTLLGQYKNTLKVLDFLYQEGVYTRERQLLAQEGQTVHFVIRPDISEEIAFIAVKGPNDTYIIVGNLAPYQSKGIIERYKRSGKTDFYVDSATSKVLEKKVGHVPYSPDRHSLNTLYPNNDFILGIDLAPEGAANADVRTLPNSKEDTPKVESEQQLRQPVKHKAGAVYVTIPTSIKGNNSLVLAEAVSRLFIEDHNNPVYKFLFDLIDAQIPLTEKLDYIMSLLDLDIYMEKESSSLEETDTKNRYTFVLRDHGHNTNYGRFENVDSEDVVASILGTALVNKVRYTVDRRYINTTFPGTGEDYNSFIGNVLEVNLYTVNPHTEGDWFTVSPISTNGDMVVGKNINEIKPHTKRGETITKSGNNVTIEKAGHALTINTDTWEVSRDGTIITPDQYNSETYTYLAMTFVQSQDATTGMYITPWGLFDLDTMKFDKEATSVHMTPMLASILRRLRRGNVEEKVKAILDYERIMESEKTSNLNRYVTAIDTALEKQGYTWVHPANVVEMWDRGNRDNIEVTSYSEDASLPTGISKVVSVSSPIIEKKGKLVSKARVIITRGTFSADQTEEITTVVATDTTGSIEWLKDKEHINIYNTLNSTSQERFRTTGYSLGERARKKYVNDTMRRLKGMSIEERNKYFDTPLARRVTPKRTKAIDMQKELAWLSEVLPQLSGEDRVRVVRGLIRIANSSEKAWGLFKNGIMYIAKNAASGTVFHEAFHAVVHTLLSNKEKAKLFAEAKKQYKVEDDIVLEEVMAEDFRRYTEFQISDSSSYLKKMWTKIKDWSRYLSGRMNVVEKTFFRINSGLYKRRIVRESMEKRYRRKTIQDVVKDIKPYRRTQAMQAHTTYKDVDTAVRQVLQEKNIHYTRWGDYAGSVEYLFKGIPNYDKVVEIVEIPETGKYTPVLYTDMWPLADLRNDEVSNYNNIDVDQDDYISEKVRLEQEAADYAKDGFDSEEYESLDEVLFYNRTQALETKYEWRNLSENQKEYLKKQKVSIKQYEAMSLEDKISFVTCFGI